MTTPTALGRLPRWLSIARESIADLLAPAACPICGTESDGMPICPDCRAGMLDAAVRCPRCALPVGPWADLAKGCSACRGRPLGFDAAVALGPYAGPIRDLCLRLKHHRDAWLARWLAEHLAVARAGALREAIGADPSRRSLVVAVPLHWRRRLARGYNQAEALADPLARALGLRSSRPLRRIKDTPKLAGDSERRPKTFRGARCVDSTAARWGESRFDSGLSLHFAAPSRSHWRAEGLRGHGVHLPAPGKMGDAECICPYSSF